MFTLINLETSERVTKASYENGRKAARAAKLLTVKTKRKYQVRKLVGGDDNWREREAAKFETGEYQRTKLGSLSPVEHYAHIALKKPHLIAYTKDEEKGRQDIQSVCSVRAYIDVCIEYWRAKGNYTESEMQAIYPLAWREDKAKQHEAYAASLCAPVKFATTPEEIAAVYTNYSEDARQVGGSCMRYDEEHFRLRVDGDYRHPAEVYGAGDLAIAYMTNASGETIARALCWPEKKLYSRVYADNDALHSALKALGYEKTRYYWSEYKRSLCGAKLLKLELDNGNGYVMPYLDEVGNVDDRGDHWVIGGDYGAQETDGYISGRQGVICDSCGEDCDEYELSEVYTNSRRIISQQWCENCCDNNAFYCNGYQVYFDEANVDSMEVDGETYSSAYVENNANYCERNEEYTFDDLKEVIVDEDGETQMWGNMAVSDDAFEFNGKWYSKDIDYTKVISARARTITHWRRALTYIIDITQQVPGHLLKELAYEAEDGEWYMNDHVDHYPVDRPRPTPINQPVILSWAHNYIENPPLIWTDYYGHPDGWRVAETSTELMAAE